MGAINVAPLSYGAVRGWQDANRDTREAQAFDSDQAIRTERLGQEKRLAPLREKALELGIKGQEQQNELGGLNLDLTKLKKTDQEAISADFQKARKQQDRLRMGIGQFHASGDPQHVADAVNELYPSEDGKASAVRNPDGSITINSPKMAEPHTFKPEKIHGVERSPDEQLGMYAYKLLDPVDALKKRVETDYGIEKESEKQGAIGKRMLDVEAERTNRAVTVAEKRAGVEKDRRVTSEIRLGNTMLNNALKTTSIPGHFQNVYSSEDDAKLARIMTERMGTLIREQDLEPEKAVNAAIEQVRTEFATSKKSALDAGAKLVKAGIDPKDKDALAAAVKGGNADAKAFVTAIGKAKNGMGDDAARYLYDQVPGRKK